MTTEPTNSEYSNVQPFFIFFTCISSPLNACLQVVRGQYSTQTCHHFHEKPCCSQDLVTKPPQLIQGSCLLMRKTVGLCINFLLSRGIVLPVMTEHHFCIKTQNVILLNSTGQNVQGLGGGALCRKTLKQQHTRISTFALSLYHDCFAWGHLSWKCA